jgi:hypothetical protein
LSVVARDGAPVARERVMRFTFRTLRQVFARDPSAQHTQGVEGSLPEALEELRNLGYAR